MLKQQRVIQIDAPTCPEASNTEFFKQEVTTLPNGELVVTWRRVGETLHIERVTTTQQHTDFGPVTASTTEKCTTPCFIRWRKLDACTDVEDDSDTAAPWHDSDGWEHECRAAPFAYGSPRTRQFRGYAADRRHGGRRTFIVTVTDASFGGDTEESRYARFRNHGATKQVAAEMVAQQNQEYIDQIVTWYLEGWHYYSVSCNFCVDGCDYGDACGGILDDELATYSHKYIKPEVINNIVHALEANGYIIVDKPAASKQTTKIHATHRRHQQQLDMFNWRT